MAKRSVSAKAIIEEIRKGTPDFEIMRQFELTPSQLKKIIEKLVNLGHISQEQLEARQPKKTKQCPFCTYEIPKEAAQCRHCGQWLEERQVAAPIEPGAADAPPPLPSPFATEPDDDGYCAWEDAENLGWFKAYTETVKESLFSPTAFFSKLPSGGSVGYAFAYGMVSITIGYLFASLWSMMLPSASGQGGGFSNFLGTFFFAPVVAAIGLLLNSFVFHVCLWILGGINDSYNASLKAVCYASGPQLFHAIPFLGSLIATVWWLVLVVIGLRETHQVSTGKVVLAIFLPIILCCGLAVFFIIPAILRGIG
jgi:hypothetical protein